MKGQILDIVVNIIEDDVKYDVYSTVTGSQIQLESKNVKRSKGKKVKIANLHKRTLRGQMLYIVDNFKGNDVK